MIKENDLVLLYKDHNRNYLVKITQNQFHTDKGFVELKEAIGKELGSKLSTNLNEDFYLLRPTLHNLVLKIKRKTQIIYPKDIGIILTKGTIFPGAKIIETGTGSGGLTTAMANFVRPNGKVYTYEQRPEFYENAKRNIEKYGLSDYVQFKNMEVQGEFEETDADFVMIDIGSQWDLVPAAYKALKGGCRMATICPSFEQLTRTVYTMEDVGFIDIETVETSVRHILVRRNKTRPEQSIPSHTGFLVFGTKIFKSENTNQEKPDNTDQEKTDTSQE